MYDDEGWKGQDLYSDDAPIEEVTTGWNEKHIKMEPILVNGAKRRHWTMGQNKIKQTMARCQYVLGQEVLSRSDFSRHYFGVQSPMFITFQRRLKWDHLTFLRFAMTCCQLSANKWTVAKLYDINHPQHNMDRLMNRDEFATCWRQIETCGLPDSRELSANHEAPLWEDCQKSLNSINRNLTVVGHTGTQLFTVDDDKVQVETDPRTHCNLNLKIVKHTADNRFGMIADTMVTTAVMLVVSVQLHIKGRKSHNNLCNQLYNDALGRCPLTPPNLQNIEFHGDHGYFSENAFLTILLLCGCMLTCTCPKGLWLAFLFREGPLWEGNNWESIPEIVIHTYHIIYIHVHIYIP